ncbi:TPA: hypothetical protein ACQJYA_003878, partial [Klebsiella variicola]
DAQQVKPHVCRRIPEATADSLCAGGEDNPLFAVGYQKPQQTHDVQPVNTNPCSQSLREASND